MTDSFLVPPLNDQVNADSADGPGIDKTMKLLHMMTSPYMFTICQDPRNSSINLGLEVPPVAPETINMRTLENTFLEDDFHNAEETVKPQPTRLPNLAELPLKLPSPVLNFLTNPHEDLSEHLSRFGLHVEALEFKRSHVDCDFVLNTFLSIYRTPNEACCSKNVRPCGRVTDSGDMLMYALLQTLEIHEDKVRRQLQEASEGLIKTPERVILPASVCVPWEETVPDLLRSTPSATPTHLAAICKEASRVVSKSGRQLNYSLTPSVIVPIHWIVYVLQCAFIPTDPALCIIAKGHTPVIPITVPFPHHWSVIHRWLYTRDTSKLLCSLVPLGIILNRMSPHQRCFPQLVDCLDALSHFSLSFLTAFLIKIRATWHNGKTAA
ncbi:hypothetical protein MEQU1_000358 [Malassezia equina]|uniref:Uncharacterized protein n=1 Tax=Malassezia equina TaxID=1381935 RepID=A0AAF0E9L5_9BASI|nr:hypothetical protein MEQU1_000358 [Malassezia equina]